MSNPIKAFEAYVGVRKKGRPLTFKERFREVSVKSLSKRTLPWALEHAAFPTIAVAFAELIQGRDTRFSVLLLMFGILLTVNIAGMKLLQAAGRKYKAAGTY